jgi:hypothetical protein
MSIDLCIPPVHTKCNKNVKHRLYAQRSLVYYSFRAAQDPEIRVALIILIIRVLLLITTCYYYYYWYYYYGITCRLLFINSYTSSIPVCLNVLNRFSVMRHMSYRLGTRHSHTGHSSATLHHLPLTKLAFATASSTSVCALGIHQQHTPSLL